MRSQLKNERGNFIPHQDLNHGPLEPIASVLTMSYADPFHLNYQHIKLKKIFYIIKL